MKHLVAVLAGSLALVASPVRAQNQVSRHVIASGGISVGSTYHVYAAIGEPVVGLSVGTTHRVCSGFECGVSGLLGGTFNAVAIRFFEARIDGHQVAVRWEILSADGLQGFNVYRSALPDGEFVRLNPALLQPQGAGRYVDASVEPGRRYAYRLGAIDRDGEFLSPVQTVTTPSWPTELSQNYPNPFNPVTVIPFYLGQRGPVVLTIHDAQGRLVKTLVDGALNVGEHRVEWNGTNDTGERVGSGVYFYRLRAGHRVLTRKLVLLK